MKTEECYSFIHLFEFFSTLSQLLVLVSFISRDYILQRSPDSAYHYMSGNLEIGVYPIFDCMQKNFKHFVAVIHKPVYWEQIHNNDDYDYTMEPVVRPSAGSAQLIS